MQQATDEAEFEKRIHENEALIFKVCRVYAFDAEDRKDLFQEIVIQLWRSYSGFRGQSQFSTWLYRVAINTAISRIRKEKRQIRPDANGHEEMLCLPITEEGPQQEKLDMLYRAIALLNPIEKAIVMLYLEEKTYEEMEEVLGLSQGNLRVKMNRIKEKLRQLTIKN